jgi:deazaflavin-dependent oxidoreductase (nitroreductase family)
MDMAAVNREVIDAFRAGGEIEGMHRERLLLLTTRGRRTGEARTTPMMFHRADDGRLLVIASNAGAAEDPQWFRNLVADPAVTVEIGDERYAATAAPLSGDDHERTWAEVTAAYPFFADHQAGVERRIPLVDLRRD